MYQKASGETVWLKAQPRSSYLVFSGTASGRSDFETLKTRLYENFESIDGVSEDAAVLVRCLDNGGSVIFCLSDCRSCALIALGSYGPECDARQSSSIIDFFFDDVKGCLEAVARTLEARITIDSIRCEIAHLEN